MILVLKEYRFFNNLFGGNTDRSNQQKIVQKIWNTSILNNNTVFSQNYFIMICSELFFNGFFPIPKNEKPIILLCNESWFSSRYIKTLMLNYVQLYALSTQKEVIYVGHYHGVFISKRGKVQNLLAIA